MIHRSKITGTCHKIGVPTVQDCTLWVPLASSQSDTSFLVAAEISLVLCPWVVRISTISFLGFNFTYKSCGVKGMNLLAWYLCQKSIITTVCCKILIICFFYWNISFTFRLSCSILKHAPDLSVCGVTSSSFVHRLLVC